MKHETRPNNVIATYRELFVQHSDAYGRQWPRERRYYKVDEPLTDQILRSHLKGEFTIGLYSIDPTGHTKWSVIDSDEGAQPLQDIRQELKAADIPSYLELSRAGGHLWIFWSRPIPAPDTQILSRFSKGYERFPSGQWVDQESGGLLLRAPLGVHQASGRRYPFVDEELRPVSPGVVRGQLAWLQANVERADSEKLPLLEDAPERPVQRIVYPDVKPSPIRAFNESHRIRDVVEQYTRVNNRGVGRCPWPEHHKHEDKHPSFQIFERSQKWWCYTAGIGGNAADWIMRHENLTPAEFVRKYCR
jgi:CHC2 zinc finger